MALLKQSQTSVRARHSQFPDGGTLNRKGARPQSRSKKKAAAKQPPFCLASELNVTACRTGQQPGRSQPEPRQRPSCDGEPDDDEERRPWSWPRSLQRDQPPPWHRWPPAQHGWPRPEMKQRPAAPSGLPPQRVKQPGQRGWRRSLRAAPDRARSSSQRPTKGPIQPRLTQPVSKILTLSFFPPEELARHTRG